MKTPSQIEETWNQIEELQLWFARKPYGWYEQATIEQRQQWEDRVREQDRLIEVLNG